MDDLPKLLFLTWIVMKKNRRCMNSKWGSYLISKSHLHIIWDTAFILTPLNLINNEKPTSNFNSSTAINIYQKSPDYFSCQFFQIPIIDKKRIPVKIIEKPVCNPIYTSISYLAQGLVASFPQEEVSLE